MEKASVGVPEALEKMVSTSDEDLRKQIEAAAEQATGGGGDELDKTIAKTFCTHAG